MAYILQYIEVFRLSDTTDADGRRVITYEQREFWSQVSPPDSYWIVPATATVQFISTVSGPALGNSFLPFCPLRPVVNLQPNAGAYSDVANPVQIVACAPGSVRVQFPQAGVNNTWLETVTSLGPAVTDNYEIAVIPTMEEVGRVRALPLNELIGDPPPPPNSLPVVSNFNPAVNTNIGTSTPISFDVTDAETGFTRILLTAQFPDSTKEVVYDGSGFSSNYSNGYNSVTPIANGFSFVLLRNGGWPGNPTITPFAIDAQGGENA